MNLLFNYNSRNEFFRLVRAILFPVKIRAISPKDTLKHPASKPESGDLIWRRLQSARCRT